MRLHTIAVLTLTLAGFALRLYYAISTHPFFDEYTTVLAARQVLRQGWPILPSGLFYEHGLLSTYLIVPFTALYIDAPLSQWQPAHWGLMLSRWPSVLVGTVTIPLIYRVGRQFYRGAAQVRAPQKFLFASAALLAAALFATSPEGMVWGGRARMYAPATLLVLLTVYWAYRGAQFPAPARFRWQALGALLAALLTQFGALTLVPPLVVGMMIIGWRSFRQVGRRPWFLRRQILPQGVALAAVVGLAILVKRLGQPLGAPALAGAETGNLLAELIDTVAYQTTFHFTWPDTIEFLARQFGVPHHFWLAIITVAGIGAAIVARLWRWPAPSAENPRLPLAPGPLFLTLVFGLIVIEMVTLLEPFRRNPRYLVMYLPLFYLVAAAAVIYLVNGAVSLWSGRSPLRSSHRAVAATLLLLALFVTIGLDDLRIALLTPEPAYQQAFAYVHANRQPGDAVLTMNTPAAALYLEQVDGFTIQNDARQFLLDSRSGPVDRWLGAPWIGAVADFNAVFDNEQRTWFVIDTIRLPVYFRGNWLATLNSQMEQVWAGDNALVYRTRPDRQPLSTRPQTRLDTTLGNAVKLVGYSLDTPAQPNDLDLTLLWQPLASLPDDYTTFLHLRDADGAIVAQRDSQPLDGAYPTSQWQPGEIVIDPITLSLPADLPPGQYTLVAGLYRLDTLERLPVNNDSSGENGVLLGEVNLP